MQTPITYRRKTLALVVAALVVSTPLLAKKPDSPGQGNGHGNSQGHGDGKGHDSDVTIQSHPGNSSHGKVHFEDRQRVVIRDYFGREFKRGNCPPGLAKKHNGCMPPGQAKKWAVGQRLPRDVRIYDLPRDLLKELGRVPSGHKYVRAGSDVLLMDVGTRTIVDAIENL